MDYKILAENLGLDESEFFEMTELFIEVSLSDLVRLEAGLKKVDADEVVDLGDVDQLAVRAFRIPFGTQGLPEGLIELVGDPAEHPAVPHVEEVHQV